MVVMIKRLLKRWQNSGNPDDDEALVWQTIRSHICNRPWCHCNLWTDRRMNNRTACSSVIELSDPFCWLADPVIAETWFLLSRAGGWSQRMFCCSFRMDFLLGRGFSAWRQRTLWRLNKGQNVLSCRVLGEPLYIQNSIECHTTLTHG